MRTVHIAAAALILGCLEAFAQQGVPVFKNAADSVEYARIQADLTNNWKLLEKSEGVRRDSLKQAQGALFEKMQALSSRILRYRTIYYPSPTLTNYNDFVKGGDPQKVKTMTISGRNRAELPDSIYLCTNLEELELVNWKLRKLPRKLNKLTRLRELTLLNNQPSSPLRLARNKSIKELNIRGDDASGKLPRKYRALRNLEMLDLSRNNITTFPNVAGCRKLTKLHLMFNEITLEDLHGRQPASIVDLNLGNNKIKTVPAAISNFTNARKLNFNNNQVERVSEEVKSMKHLEEISFYKNKLKSIPEPVYALPSLKVIDLYFNEIEKADARLGQMQSLEILYLANNRIYSLPDNLGQLPKLRELYLHNNRISNLPSSVGSLHQLTVLRINNNSILEFPEFLFKLQQLQNLDVSHNQLTTIDLEHFAYKDLKILALVGNPWDDTTKEALPAFADRLRTNYKTVVHLNTYADVVE